MIKKMCERCKVRPVFNHAGENYCARCKMDLEWDNHKKSARSNDLEELSLKKCPRCKKDVSVVFGKDKLCAGCYTKSVVENTDWKLCPRCREEWPYLTARGICEECERALVDERRRQRLQETKKTSARSEISRTIENYASRSHPEAEERT